MLNSSDQRNLQKLFAELPLNEEAFNLQALQGYLYAIAITPDVIVPSEWLPVIFGGEMPEYYKKKTPNDLFCRDSCAYAVRNNHVHFSFHMF